MFTDTLNYVFYGNRVLDYLIVLGAIVVGVIVIRLIKFVVVRRIVAWAKKKDTPLDADLVKSISKASLPVLYLGTVYVAAKSLTFPENVAGWVDIVGKILLALLGARLVIAILAGAIKHYWLPREGDVGREKTVKALMPIVKIAVWIVAAIFLLDNLGFKISTVVAGLGIGGVAVALAGQAILKDLFSYFAILFDQPFEIGDQIRVDDKIGTVEKVGVKTTRLKSIGGEQLVFSNADLTDSRVQNYKRMDRRRIATHLGVTYETPAAKLKKIPALVEGIIDPIDGVDFDRAHFASYGDFNLVFEVVYFVQGNDYKKYMDIQEEINLRLYEAFAKEKIEFAYPTQTVYLPPAARPRGKK
ncbi:MAG: mechanosensitive ion channel family protein [Candidatus Coatesbacteria bacterium]|nr:MAG: mechanosensitive ion channel family protein [Candidatus Coatesbacteria bacterium]